MHLISNESSNYVTKISWEGLVNAITITSLPEENCEVRFTGTMTGKDELEIETKKKILDETYHKILNGLKDLHDRN